MKKILAFASFLLSMQAFATGGTALTGQWSVRSSIAGNESEQHCSFVQAGDKLTGTCKSPDNEVQITGSVEDRKVSWKFNQDYNGSQLTLTYTATLDDSGKISGSVDVQPFGVKGEFTAAPATLAGTAGPTTQSAAMVASLTLRSDQAGPVINRDIFGQFAEHLGEGIYGGVWVGRKSKIPNLRGIRTDVVQALREIKVPVVRWPGGCFADEYNWRNGIGPADHRAATVNSNWGAVLEPNTFGTDEFMDFIAQIGSEAYISVNLGSGTPQEAAAWLEYMTADVPTALEKERVSNGHETPYRVKYLGLGNESWGCGGSFTPDAYVTQMKLYSHFVHNLHPAQRNPSLVQRSPEAMMRIASGPDGGKTEYTEAVMKAWKGSEPWYWGIEGLSLHSYTWGGFPMSSPATDFGEKEYATVLKETLGMDGLIAKHSAIMDKYDPQKKVALVVDEWGVWLKPTPGSNPSFLQQQNSLRDAILAALNLNIFARHADRVRMTNIAQMVNVLQAMILTDGNKMLLTPTYYIYKMYVPFQDATLIPASINAGEYKFGSISIPRIDAMAARAKDGRVWLSLVNTDPNQPAEVDAQLAGVTVKSVTGQVLTATRVDAVNTFEEPDAVSPKPFSVQAVSGRLLLTLPPKSVTVVRVEQ